MAKLLTLSEILHLSVKLDLLCDNMHLHTIERYRPHGADNLFVQVDDSTFVAGKYHNIVLIIYTRDARYVSNVTVHNVQGVICLLLLKDIKIEKRELRETKRVDLLSPILVESNYSQIEATLINISLGGVCFQSQVVLPLMTGVIFFDTTQKQTISLNFKVVTSRTCGNSHIYHCKFENLMRSTEVIMEREINALQLRHIRRTKEPRTRD